jgi:ATP/maltotriose-dependent transcriptional regulator MalT
MHGPLRELGTVAYHRGEIDRAILLYEQALAIARETGSAFGAGLAMCGLADALRARGEVERARMLLEESLVSLRREEPGVITNALVNTLNRLGSIACETGDDVLAATLYGESLDLTWQLVGKAFEVVACLEGLARVATIQGQPERAAMLLGASAALREEMRTPLPPFAEEDHDDAWNSAREALGEVRFETAWTAGNARPLEATVVEVIAIT